MAITKSDVKLMKSERMDDTDEGGGRMSGTEIIDGNVNNMFDDISRLDRTKGRVSMRKGFVGAFTANNDTYGGAHVILTEPATDPLVSVCIFTTNNPFDVRADAQNRVESYVAQGTRFPGYLWGLHIQGARAVSIIQEVSSKPPGVGDVLYLSEGDDYQYVRITDITITATSFENAGTKNVVACGISDPLRYDFHGYEPADANKTGSSMIYGTVVADASSYFGVMHAVSEISKNDTSIDVDSIYTHLVPSAQSESPIVDVTAGNVPTICIPADDFSFTLSGSITAGTGKTVHFPVGAKPGTLFMNISGFEFATSGGKVICTNFGNEECGVVDWGSATVSFNPDYSTALDTTTEITYTPAFSQKRIGNSKALPVLLANRGYNYVTSLTPLPSPGSVVVSYMAEGEWYDLEDDGEGVLRGVSGSGSVNYQTGAVIITCGALPDANTAIVVSWGAPNEYIFRGNKQITTDFDIRHTVAAGTIEPGSLSITFWVGGNEYTATDDGAGNITGTYAGGVVLYGKGEVRFRPTVNPDVGSTVTFDSNSIETVTENLSLTLGNNSFTLANYPIKPGTFSIRSDYTGHSYTTSILIEDDGAGNLIFNDGAIQLNRALGHGEWEGNTTIQPMAVGGTINYNTGEVFFHGTSTGLVNWLRVTITTETVTTE